MAVMVIGGARYIGSNTVTALLERGSDVVVVDSMVKGHKQVVLGGKLYSGDVRDAAFLYKVFTKNNLYESVWRDEYIGGDDTINVHISNIRSKISKLRPSEKYIQTVWGIGYKLLD